MNRIIFTLLVLVSTLLSACGKDSLEKDSLGPGEIDKWNDPNIDIIGVGAYNYTDYDIYDVFILPPDKNDLKYAAGGHGAQAAPHSAERWGYEGGGAKLAWDYRWTVPRKFKVWWFRIVDMKAHVAAGRKYDKYTMKETSPGAAWCEGEIEVAHAPVLGRGGDLVIHYYPDGHIEGDVIDIDGDVSRVDIKKRNELPVLKDRACLKEVPNPYFGKKKPTAMY